MDSNDRVGEQTNQKMEIDLLRELRLRQTEWIRASEEDRVLARQRFINALDAFNRLVLHGEPRD